MLKIGIKCSNQFLLVAPDQKTSKPHFHGPIRRRISQEDKKLVRIFQILPIPSENASRAKKCWNFSEFLLKESTRQMFFTDLFSDLIV